MLKILFIFYIALLRRQIGTTESPSPMDVILTEITMDCPKRIHTCERGKISFYFYKELLKPYEELVLHDVSTIKNASFIPNADFKVLIHGYLGSKDWQPEMVTLRNEYLKAKKWNVLVVDWGPLATDGCYLEVAFPSVPLVGQCCADFINAILENRPEIKVEQFHFLGLSMGAQICARFALHFRPKVIPRITGLDPAFPKFFPPFLKPHEILNRNHAKFVDVIHSNMGVFGVLFSDAHYDIYCNKGSLQPGCDLMDLPCHHLRGVLVFAESINSKTKFFARKCRHNWVFVTFRRCDGHDKRRIEVGEYCLPPADEKDTGTYHFQTTSHPPYAIGPHSS